MSKLTSKTWWSKAAERAIKTLCQTIVAMAGTNAVLSFADWRQILIASATAGVLSIITSIASISDDKGTDDEDPETVVQAKIDEEAHNNG